MVHIADLASETEEEELEEGTDGMSKDENPDDEDEEEDGLLGPDNVPDSGTVNEEE